MWEWFYQQDDQRTTTKVVEWSNKCVHKTTSVNNKDWQKTGLYEDLVWMNISVEPLKVYTDNNKW